MNELKPILFIFLVSSLAYFLPTSVFAQPGFGKAEKINLGWSFKLQEDKILDANSKRDRSWKEIRLPYDWTIKEPLSPTLASATGYLPGGIGWYQKEIEIPAEKEGEQVFLYFEGVYNRSEVFVNGKSVGKRPNGYVSFSYDISPYLNYGGNNLISVKVDHSKDADSRWYTGSGIYRDVWLVYANKIRLDQWGVYAYPELNKGKSGLNIQVEMLNQSNAESIKCC
ncbi:sugar-binding domain-containing protein [Sphingobacterium endophyticum]|uniref:sugar-binding domain-containing protein n=1 Tax=Sphingobacterium endophyticum TaxID=2546448 RepID=UPI0018CF211C|nr:sugar-binding domain-containing protein [Sphingobacterium endophyticum]